MEQSTDRIRSLGMLLVLVGVVGAAAGAVVLAVFDFFRVFQLWLIEVVAVSRRLLATPGLIVESQILAVALLALVGGIVLFSAGAAVVGYGHGQRGPERRLPASTGAESARVA